MRYALVATPKYLLCVDLVSKKIASVETGRSEYYGVSWFPNKEQLILSHSGLDNSTLVDIASYAQSEVGYISSGQKRSRPFLSQPHQIVCAPDGRVVCTNTGRNVITVIDLEKPGFYHEASVSPERWDRLSLDATIGDHINSVFIKDDQLFVMCHRFNRGSLLATFSYPSLELLSAKPLDGYTGLHNIWVTKEGQAISCDSETAGIIDLSSGSTLWQSETQIYTRGLAATDNYIIVGESQKTGRDIRGRSLSSLWILDRTTWQTIDYISLGHFGCVNEVRLLDVPDEAHHGQKFNALDQLLATCDFDSLERLLIPCVQEQPPLDTHPSWKDYSFIFDAATTLEDGSKSAAKDILCLAILRQEANLPIHSFAFQYTLSSNESPSHVSAVLGYHGSIDDTHMHTILLQANKNKARLVVLQHNGNKWRTLKKLRFTKIPLSGTLKTHISQHNISVFIDQKEVLRLEPERINLKYYNSGLGIRWSGATVIPEVLTD